ncbi:ATP-binding cassette domain-containing protein [Rhodococcus hoagii]|nr:ATP-binding cassette domain-containing protein [Prescottella equi]
MTFHRRGSWGSIRIESLGRTFGGVTAVDDISMEIRDGDFLVLLGPSGCGKTTLLRMIAGLLEPTSGRIVLDGEDITSAPARKRDVAMVFQNYALYPHLSVARNLGFPLRVRKVPKEEAADRVDEVAQQLEIAHLLDRKPKELSGGQRQRVAVGRAIVRNPKAFLMDEPLSNLDAKLRTATRRELTELHRRLGATFVYVTHDQVEAMTMATRIALLNRGAVEQIGTPEEVYDRPASVFVAGFLGSPAMNLLDATVLSIRGTVRAEAPGLRADLWAGTTEDLDVVLGIRPEHLRTGTRRGGRLTHRHSRFRREPRQRGDRVLHRRRRHRVRPVAAADRDARRPVPHPHHRSRTRTPLRPLERSPARVDRHLAALRLPRLFR